MTVEGYVGHMAVESFSWSITAQSVKTKEAEPRTTVSPNSLTLTKQFDSASAGLCQMMESDKPFNATLRYIDPSTRVKGGAAGKPSFDSVLEIELVACHIENISLRAAESGKSMSISETVELSFEKSITLTYRSYDATQQIRSKAVTAKVDTSTHGGK